MYAVEKNVCVGVDAATKRYNVVVTTTWMRDVGEVGHVATYELMYLRLSSYQVAIR